MGPSRRRATGAPPRRRRLVPVLAASVAAGALLSAPSAVAAPSPTSAATISPSATATATPSASPTGTPPSTPGVRVVASGLDDPAGLHEAYGLLFVAETSGGRVDAVVRRTGKVRTLLTGLASPTSVDVALGHLVVTTGGADVPDASTNGNAKLLAARLSGRGLVTVADLLAYEKANNPDGQTQQTGPDADALSNPFGVLAGRGRWGAYVADAGANDVLGVDRQGGLHTFFVPPVVTEGACAGQPNNDPAHAGCDPVPTAIAYGPGNTLYVSTLSGEAPGLGRVYVLDASTGRQLRVIGGLDGPTGVAVAPDGTVYVSEVTYLPGGAEPGPTTDPATIGRIVRISPTGARSAAHVTMPLGLDWADGRLYATAWSVADQFIGTKTAGQIVEVSPRAFSAIS